MDSATEKLELGLQRLAKARDDADLLGLALQSIHGALEDHFRARLAADSHIPADQRAALLDPKRAQWKELLDAMQLYGDLSAQDRELIWRTNGLRTRVAHGGRYTGSRAELERYAALVQSLSGYTPPAKPAGSTARRPASEKSARQPASARPASTAPEIPRARRAGSPAAQPRSPSHWPGGLIALILLVGLALFVVLRTMQPPAGSAAISPSAGLPPASAATAAPGTQPPTEVRPTALPRGATVTAEDGLYLRKDHTRSADLVASLAKGTRVTIVGGPVQADQHTWWNVEVGGQRGWCAGEFLTLDKIGTP